MLFRSLPDMSAPYKGSGKVDHRAWFSPLEYKTLYTRTRELAQSPPTGRSPTAYEELHDAVLFLGNSGLRPDEALCLTLGDVAIEFDEETRQRILAIEVRGKRGYGPCKTMPGAVMPFRRIVERRTAAYRAERQAAGDPGWQTAPVDPNTPVFPSWPRYQLNSVLGELKLKTDRDGHRRTFYSLRHTYICLRLLDGANAYEIAKNCRTSVDMIEQHYGVHLKNYINTALVNTRGGVRRDRNKSSLAKHSGQTRSRNNSSGRGGTGRRNGLKST